MSILIDRFIVSLSKSCARTAQASTSNIVYVTHHGIGLRRGDRSDLLQLFDHGPIANVPGVENIIDAFKMSSDHGIESAVGVGNHSNPNGAPLVHGTTTVWDPIEACTCFQSNVKDSKNLFGKCELRFQSFSPEENLYYHHRDCRDRNAEMIFSVRG